MQKTTFTLKDESGRELRVRVRASGGILEISPEGYGEATAEDGVGSPLLLDWTATGLKVHVSADIFDDGLETIDLEGAREARRR